MLRDSDASRRLSAEFDPSYAKGRVRAWQRHTAGPIRIGSANPRARRETIALGARVETVRVPIERCRCCVEWRDPCRSSQTPTAGRTRAEWDAGRTFAA